MDSPTPTNSPTLTPPDQILSDPKHTDIEAWIEDMEILCEKDRIPDTDTQRPLYAAKYMYIEGRWSIKIKRTLELAQGMYDPVGWTQFKNFMLELYEDPRCISDESNDDDYATVSIEKSGDTHLHWSCVCTDERSSIE